ncbi:toll/interleukin-1 receptor domain-containing protein [Kribbella sp. NPDC050459]|uniref:toll/interleukin-1 receptor domain-containing protein n=1 Tax=Kribbella sp. NPDC050459 TaxID=3155785 RepID=UPI0033EC4B69
MSEDNVGPIGFWSYVHKDDEGVDGRILRLARRLSDEFSLLTGQELSIFIDRSSLEWGNEWDQRINVALQETTFFIPVITPRYFLSSACRGELLRFSGYARSLGAEELLLPIYYVNVADLADDSDDEAKSLIAKTQYQDWRKLRLVDEGSAEYAQAVNDMALRLADISRDYSAKPTLTPDEVASEQGGGGVVDDEPGVGDLIAQLEEAIPKWLETIESLPLVTQEITEIIQRATDKLNAGNEEGKGFAYRVLVAREIAAEIAEPAERLKNLGERYAAQLLEMDPGVRAFISVSGEPERTEEERQSALEAFDSIVELVATSQDTRDSISGFADSVRGPAKQFRDLRPGMNTIEAGLRNVIDAQSILEEWGRLIETSPLKAVD